MRPTPTPLPPAGWTILVEEVRAADPSRQEAIALTVDPHRLVVMLGPESRAAGSGNADGSAVARSFFDDGARLTAPAATFLRGPEAAALLARIASGVRGEELWSGDLVLQWSDDAWEAGHQLWIELGERMGQTTATARP